MRRALRWWAIRLAPVPFIAVTAGVNFGNGEDYVGWLMVAWIVAMALYASWSDSAYQQGFWAARLEFASALEVAKTGEEFAAVMERAHHMTPHAWHPAVEVVHIETVEREK